MKSKFKKILDPLFHFFLTIGFDARHVYRVRHLTKFRTQYNQFKKLGGVITRSYPVLSDYDTQAGSASGHYFHQDLLIASFIHNKNPIRHIDVGSRIDGLIAHVASFRRIDVMDVRELSNTGHQNISFIKADLMDKDSAQNNLTDSISCLHAIEHFGLGRYGDPIDPKGHLKGFNNIVRMLKPEGYLYISFPIGKANEVYFNAHRVFHPKDIFTWAEDKGVLDLERFDYVDDIGNLHQNVDLEKTEIDVVYGCGIYTFKKSKMIQPFEGRLAP
jgi:predicted SAM-dependent methyltransferase